MKLVVGLGNPGSIYTHTRHNIGFHCLNYFARIHSIRFDNRQCRARIGIGQIAGDKLLLARPGTFVNLSGTAVSCLVRKHGIPTGNLLVIHDDLDLPLGKIRLRQGGGSGGHKGMASIISSLGSDDFPRIRMGIGRPEVRGLPSTDEAVIVDYVLSNFTPVENDVIKASIATVADAIDCFLAQGMEVAMSNFN